MKVTTSYHLWSSFMFSPSTKGQLLAELANRHYNTMTIFAGLAGLAREDQNTAEEIEIQRAEASLTATQFIPIRVQNLASLFCVVLVGLVVSFTVFFWETCRNKTVRVYVLVSSPSI